MKNKHPKGNNAPPKPMVQARINIDIMSDGSTRVSKLPNNYYAAKQIMQKATNIVLDTFLKAAINGQLDKTGTLGGSNIIVPKIVLPSGPVNRG